MRARTERLAGDDAGCDREHVLDGAAKFHADEIARPVDSEGASADRARKFLTESLGGCCERHRCRQPARAVGGETRTRQ